MRGGSQELLLVMIIEVKEYAEGIREQALPADVGRWGQSKTCHDERGSATAK